MYEVIGYNSFDLVNMIAVSLWFKDRLDGASNFLCWKARINLVLKKYDL